MAVYEGKGFRQNVSSEEFMSLCDAREKETARRTEALKADIKVGDTVRFPAAAVTVTAIGQDGVWAGGENFRDCHVQWRDLFLVADGVFRYIPDGP